MPSFVYRYSNLTIMLLLTVLITSAMEGIPLLIQAIPFLAPSDDSTKSGFSLFGPIASSLGLLIGFLLSQAQSNFGEVEGVVSAEAGRINNLDRLLLRFGSPEALAIRVQLQQYIESIINNEWPELLHERGCEKTHLLWRGISQKIFKLNPETPKQLSIYADIMKKSEDVAESRESRIDRSEHRLPTLFWAVIFICLGALICLNALFLRPVHLLFGITVLSIAYGGLISLLVITDQPFKGQSGIRPDALRKVLASIKTRVE